MADTDEMSTAYAKESEQAAKVAQSDMTELTPLLNALGLARENRAFDAFKTQFSEYRKLDQNILELAVENTNLKAQSLSFGPARRAADAFRDALAPLAASVRALTRVDRLHFGAR